MASKELDLGNVTGPVGPQGGVGPAGPQGVQGVPGRDATVNGYNAVTLEATGNVALTQEEGAVTIKTSEALDATVKWHSNPPLLRNRYFVGGGSQRGGGQLPINQLGKTEYTGIGYSIDGWNIAELLEGASVKIENDGIIITASSDHFIHFNQQIEHYLTLKGSVVTASLLLADGSLLWTSFPLGEVGNGISLIPNEVYIFSIDALHFCIRVLPQKSIKMRAVNLELGDTQTFAHKEGDQWAPNDPPPNYQQELAKCQWHQVVYGGSGYAPIGRFICYTDGTVRIFVDLPTTIRIAPAVRIIGMVRLHPIDGVDIYLPADSAVTYVNACNNTLVFDCPSPGAKQGQTGWADLATADAKLIIDANL